LQGIVVSMIQSSSKIVLIGASTGGPGIIEQIIRSLPESYPYPICIVQHFPSELTHSFASRLQTCTSNRVVESSEGLILRGGMIVVAHGGSHLSFRLERGDVIVTHKSGQEGSRYDFVPSVDEMFLSAAEVYSPSAIMAILLSGIGDDGAEGMGKIFSCGGMTLCQDEASSAVFGMPRQAIDRGVASYVLPPAKIAEEITIFGR
jgi:two-component system, chemotaxis family, protein-glutamate methylesterase/glutaminase